MSAAVACPSHPEANLIQDYRAGDLICPECGLVVGDRLVDVGTEWRSFNNEKSCSDPSRVGAPENALLSGGDLSTAIAVGPGGGSAGWSTWARSGDRSTTRSRAAIRRASARPRTRCSPAATSRPPSPSHPAADRQAGRPGHGVAIVNNEKSCSDPSRVGAPENALLSGGDLSTAIAVAPDGGSADDIGLVNSQRKQMNSADRQMTQGMQVIREMSDRIHLPKSIQDKSNKTYKDVLDSRALKGKNYEAVAAACLYIACRQEGVPRTFKEICAVSRVSKKDISRCFKLILKTLETNLDQITSEDFMSRFCSTLGLPVVVQTAATHIAKQAVKLDLIAGRSPISLAAAAIYMASLASATKKTAKEIGDIAGTAEVTVKQTYRQLYPRAAELFPASFVFTTPIQQLPYS